ncbi:MAG TPA: hypothetical protein PLY31_09195 [Tenuifilaceae bacterium]|nr:hypothetical protein [Tenuifilaceae bacterium]HPM90621.1 hypothetical protein [Tenuifilaceae bacterium]HPW27296.1 hypothetical protein [Tenuifilaceae bacterium]
MKKLPPQNEGKDKGFQIPELVRLPAELVRLLAELVRLPADSTLRQVLQ